MGCTVRYRVYRGTPRLNLSISQPVDTQQFAAVTFFLRVWISRVSDPSLLHSLILAHASLITDLQRVTIINIKSGCGRNLWVPQSACPKACRRTQFPSESTLTAAPDLCAMVPTRTSNPSRRLSEAYLRARRYRRARLRRIPYRQAGGS